MSIGGNTTALLQAKHAGKANSIGEKTAKWRTSASLWGWLDLAAGQGVAGQTDRLTYNAKIQSSTHIFICDYRKLSVTAEQSRVVIEGQPYDVLLIDDPMGMHRQLEIYLKMVGEQGAE